MKSRITRYTAPKGAEAEYEPGSRGRVLRNLVHEPRKREVDRMEFEALVRMQEDYLARVEASTVMTTSLICGMHRDWLGGLYSWAGQYRSVELAKGGFRWPPCHLVAKNMADFEDETLKRLTPCRSTGLDQVALAMAEVHAEFLLIHPFRDGNGRIARWIASLMALQANFPMPDYRLSGPGSKTSRDAYLPAVQRGYLKDYAALATFFAKAIERRLPRG